MTRPSNALAAWATGTVLLVALCAELYRPLSLPFLGNVPPYALMLGAWILLVSLMDDLGGGWFAYLGVLAGLLRLVLPPNDPPVGQWWVVAPLIGGGLWAYLLIKHAAGNWALPLAIAALVAPIMGARFLAPELDTSLTLPFSELMWNWTLGPAIIGASISVLVALLRGRGILPPTRPPRPPRQAKPETA
ncbi:hypothetical protein HNR42_001104 [Deinobacterium chartae]|uniref:Uncharacterized protein n=1 Tax=Deinobacterium chartae TaxID=521158 RepID=A0A841HWB7_9DEIO|nr:hypothetical protein [Deinobacterium chartae]MBB6097687.1 hypothetical protein [Deinobacterium chartae]